MNSPALSCYFLLGLLPSLSLADTIDWAAYAGAVGKPDYTPGPAVFEVTSSEGAKVGFKIRHLATSPGLYSYSKWEIDRWGDPTGFFTQPGAWHVVNDAANDYALGLWGYWGSGQAPLQAGNQTSYLLEIVFDTPVTDLMIPIKGINALIDDSGNRSKDTVIAKAFLAESDRTESFTFSSLGASVDLTKGILSGDPGVPMGSVSGFYPNSDDGNATLAIADKVNRVEIAIISEATQALSPSAGDSAQNWSISLGDLSFNIAPPLNRATLAWAPLQDQLEKPGYNSDSDAIYVYASDDTGIALDLNYVFTTGDKFSYSKWEINRWGDPNGVFAPKGSWQVVSNAFNDIVLAPWGYWGTDGSAESPLTEIGDETTYQLIMTFARPVSDLSFELHSIDALLTDDYNSIDHLEIRSFLSGEPRRHPVSVGRYGQLPVVNGSVDGSFDTASDGTPTSNNGTVQLKFPDPVDQVDLTFTTTADHPNPALFSGGFQNWSFGVGDLSFLPEGVGGGQSTSITWAQRRAQLTREEYSTSPGNYQAVSQDGAVTASFAMSHLGTTDNKFSYWKWEIDRWGDPNAVFTPEPGAWQIVTNEANDIVFGIWGYWGTDGSAGAPPVEIGDETSYLLSITFDQPVKELDFSLNGINGFLKPVDGFNSQDIITVETSLNGVSQGSPTYSQAGDAFTRSGNVLIGDYGTQIVDYLGGQHVSDQGSIRIQLADPVDRVDLILVNRAGHLDPALFQNGLQTFSYTIGDLHFKHD